MATPGWYPDPAGQPGAFRYWDGTAWGSDLADNPYGRPPGDAAPPSSTPSEDPTRHPGTPPPSSEPTAVAPAFGRGQPGQGYQQPYAGGYGQQPPQAPQGGQGWSSGPPAQPSWSTGPAPKSGSGKTIGIVVVAVLVVLALGVGTFFVVRSVTDDDGESAKDDPTSQTDDPTTEGTSDPTTEATTDPTEDPTADPVDPFTDPAKPTSQQCNGGAPLAGATGQQGDLQTGGGLAMTRVPGFSGESDQAKAFTFADGAYAPSKVIESTDTTGWVAVYALGALSRANDFTSPGQAAGVVLECMTQSTDFYKGFSGATLLKSEATTVDGADAWVMDAEIRIDDPELNGLGIEGDVAKVVVVDTGDPDSYGLFVSVVPIGDQALIDQQQTQQGLLTIG